MLPLLFSGWTGEKIGICGDSAGGNLALTVTMRLIAMGLPGPDAVLSMYGCMLIHYIPSPSRMMTLMDPLLPIGIMANCLAGKRRQNDLSEIYSVLLTAVNLVIEYFVSIKLCPRLLEINSVPALPQC